MSFPPLTHDQLVQQIKSFDAVRYCKNRNYLNGWVSKLSPYITHGIITIDEIVRLSLSRFTIDQAESRYKELLRREYFVQVHYHQGTNIFTDMETDKTALLKYDILPPSVQDQTFHSPWVNETIKQLESTGYLHNHQRMRLASYMTHRHRLYWKKCADWTYYHFLDGELGSNHLSRQRVASTFSGKPYFMNEENLQRYRPGVSDSIYRGSYEEVESRLFDPGRKSDMADQPDVHASLVTDLSGVTPAKSSYHDITILTPWDLHPSKITNPSKTICLLDTDFLTRHPRSAKRVQFIAQYCELYQISLVCGSVSDILVHSSGCTIYETRNPIYREAFIDAAKRWHTLVPHQRCSQIAPKQYTKKFFPFWEKTSKHLYEMQRETRG